MAYAQPNLNEALIPSTEGKYPNYQKTSSTILGTCHIIIVVTLIVINSVGVSMHETLTWGVAGTMVWNLAWCGLYGITAAFVLVAGRSPRRGMVTTSMVLSIITAVFNGCMTITCATMILNCAASVDYDHDPDYDHDHDHGDDYDYVNSMGYYKDQTRLIILFFSLNLVASVALTVVSIWSSALGCKVTCCGQVVKTSTFF
ncbi:hypothetical protein NP493_997g00017 [Ridgeia piscesae]|uniref:Uncharacterized protein n=1 Tax=Ridgeia piscesae TaxID=27915 RepID=A0AAD9KIR4_RIDPI|nr:hypothetical protein NP493_997g00017 [Ridgeia piscesae]